MIVDFHSAKPAHFSFALGAWNFLTTSSPKFLILLSPAVYIFSFGIKVLKESEFSICA